MAIYYIYMHPTILYCRHTVGKFGHVVWPDSVQGGNEKLKDSHLIWIYLGIQNNCLVYNICLL